MNKTEQVQLCMLLAKLRYDLMEACAKTGFNNKNINDILDAINKIMAFGIIDGNAIDGNVIHRGIVDENEDNK